MGHHYQSQELDLYRQASTNLGDPSLVHSLARQPELREVSTLR